MSMTPIRLTGRFVDLAPLEVGHAPGLFSAYACDRSIWQWLPYPVPVTLTDMEAIVASGLEAQQAGHTLAFTQMELATGRPVGRTNYLNISPRDRGLEIGGTWLGRPWQRSAINTEAKFLLLQYAFEALHVVRVQLKTDSRNRQSQTAIERLGAVREGTLRRHMLVRDDHIRDSVIYSIVEEEWPAVRDRLRTSLERWC